MSVAVSAEDLFCSVPLSAGLLVGGRHFDARQHLPFLFVPIVHMLAATNGKHELVPTGVHAAAEKYAKVRFVFLSVECVVSPAVLAGVCRCVSLKSLASIVVCTVHR